MKLILTIVLLIGIFTSPLVYSQDIHFTNYNYSPLYLSPAKTGSFLGTYRVGANVRTQFSTFIEKPYQTLMAFADMPIAFGIKEHHWIGAGVNVFRDKAGDLDFQNSGAQLSLAYHYAIDPKYKTVITLGLQYGLTKRSIDATNYSSEHTLRNGSGSGLVPLGGGAVQPDEDLALLNNFNPILGDLGVGLSLKKQTSKKSYIDLGISVNHLAQAEYEFTGSIVQNEVSRRFNGYVEYHIQSSKQLAIKPVLVYSRIRQFQNLFGQFNLEYRLSKKSTTLVKGGLGYRVGDALQFLAGMEYKGWDVGLAFDLTVSSAAAYTNGYGGLEIGVKKIIVANRVPKPPPPVILCPKF